MRRPNDRPDGAAGRPRPFGQFPLQLEELGPSKAIHRLTLYDPGPAGVERRARAFPGLKENWAVRVPDIIGLGPEAASDEAGRSPLFGED